MHVRSVKLALIIVTAVAALAVTSQQRNKPAKAGNPSAAATSGSAEAMRLNNLGAAYLGQQRIADAVRTFERAHQLDPKLAVVVLNEGIASLNDQKIDQARKLLVEFTTRHPENARAWYNLGLLYKGSGQAALALSAFEHAAQFAPADADVFYFIGATAAQAGEPDKAIAAFQKALKLNPYHASAEFGLARVYQQKGNMAEARTRLAEFQRITQSKLGVPMSLAYGDQGPLSMAEMINSARPEVAPAVPVSFKSVEVPAGLVPTSTTLPSSRSACVLDFDGDGRPDIYTGTALFRNVGGGKFEDVTKAAGLTGAPATACASADFDNDGHADLAVAYGDRLVLYRNQGNGTFKDVTETAGIKVNGTISSLTWFDFDHDGDTDLYVTISSSSSGAGNLLWRNNGNGTFTNWTAETGLAAAGGSVTAVPTDFNNDRAIDLLVTGPQTELFENPREGKWRATSLAKLPKGTSGAAVLDFNKDGAMDVALTLDHAPGIELLRNVEGKSVATERIPDLHWSRGWGIAAVDFDNDGWIDLVATGERSDGKGELRLLRNEGPKGWRDVTSETGVDKVQLAHPREVSALDFDGDGATDLLITQESGSLKLLRNEGGNQNHFVALSLKGLNDNKSAVGAKVEVFAGDLYQKFEVSGAALFGQNAQSLVVGIGKRPQADVVRILWPTGVVQDEIGFAAGKSASITEIDRRGSSCPVLFAWDGTRYRFVTDMLGAGVLGHWVAPGERNVPDPTEYVKLETFSPAPRKGRLSFRLIEPMEEVVYIDQVRLLAIDHPAAASVYPNEYFASNPPYPEFKVISASHSAPVRAWNDDGREVTELLSRRDHRYVSGFTLLPFKGFTRTHTLQLDLGEQYNGGPLRLLMTGYIEYFTATSMYAADQAGIHPIAPYVEALKPDGSWVRVTDDMGFPAGLPRTITVDLTGKLPMGAHRIRITTNLQVYWDQVLVDRSEQLPVVTAPDREGVVVRDVPLASARLRFHGYPRSRETRTPGDLSYHYEDISATGPYSRESGAYTRPGDVLSLLREVDDRFAIFGSGEEVAVEFDPSGLPPLAPGWKRDYFFFADGYEKDMDFYAADPNTVTPLPFHSMGEYPPRNSYPDNPEHTRYRLEYNTRFVGNFEPPSFQFHYKR